MSGIAIGKESSLPFKPRRPPIPSSRGPNKPPIPVSLGFAGFVGEGDVLLSR